MLWRSAGEVVTMDEREGCYSVHRNGWGNWSVGIVRGRGRDRRWMTGGKGRLREEGAGVAEDLAGEEREPDARKRRRGGWGGGGVRDRRGHDAFVDEWSETVDESVWREERLEERREGKDRMVECSGVNRGECVSN